MPISRSEALLAYLACGYPESPSEQMLEYVATAVQWARGQSDSAGGPGAWPQHFQHDWYSFWNSIGGDAPAQTLIDSGLMHVALQGVKQSPTDYDTPAQFSFNVLRMFLLPVALYAYYERHGILDNEKQAKIARRTRAAIDAGTRVTICATAPMCYDAAAVRAIYTGG